MEWANDDCSTIQPPLIENICCFCTVEGQPCVVAMSQEQLQIVLSMAAAVSESGSLPVRKLSEEYQVVQFKESDFINE